MYIYTYMYKLYLGHDSGRSGRVSSAQILIRKMDVLFGCCSLYQLLALVAILAVLGAAFKWYFVNGTPCRSKERMDNKTVIITGGNTGIGKETALGLAVRGARIILACRDRSRGEAAVKDIKERSGNNEVIFKQLDLASLKSVRQFSETILQEESNIDVLINNAGVMFPPYTLTEDGFELQFGVNHLGHFLLTHLLLDRIKDSAPSRILNISSHGHYMGSLDFEDMMWSKHYQAQKAYFRSKVANVMFTRELAKRLGETNVTVYAIHPGSVNTELSRHIQKLFGGIFKVPFNSTLTFVYLVFPVLLIVANFQLGSYTTGNQDTSSRGSNFSALCYCQRS